MKDINVGIVGAGGFTGLELIKMIINHKHFNLCFLSNTKGSTSLSKLHPSLESVFDMEVEATDVQKIASLCDLTFLCLPHQESALIAQSLVDLGVRVVDLSADFRLSLANYEEWYCEHKATNLLETAVYGLPEINKEQISKANLVANPGCYPTASCLAIIPFLDLINNGESIYIDAKSGVSGAGKAPKPHTTFANLSENFFAYSPLGHRHEPEIKEKLESLSNKTFNILFVPHLLPIIRGMEVSVFFKINQKIDPIKQLKEYYKNDPFIRIRQTPVQIKDVAGTNFCDIYADIKGDSLYVSSVIDNLLRGASSCAMMNANIMFGLEEDEALPKIANVP